MKKSIFTAPVIFLMVILCSGVTVFAQNTLEELKKEIAEQRNRLEELESRLNKAIVDENELNVPKDGSETQESAAIEDEASASEHMQIVGVSQREKLYGSFLDEGFAKSVPLFGSDWRFSFGGYVKLDIIHDFDGTGDELQFTTPTIPVKGAPGPQPGSYTNIHARESRFGFEVRNARDGLPFNKAFLEMDFYDANNTAPRLRHAYMQWGNLLAGQTWSTNTVLAQLPFLLDFAYGDALFGGRYAQIRWDQKIDDNWSWATAIEDWPDNAVANPYDLPGTARAEWPQFALRGNYTWSHGTVSLGTNLAQVRWDGTNGISNDAELSWAFIGGGRWFLDAENRHYIGFGGLLWRRCRPPTRST